MKNLTLAESYLEKARVRLKVLQLLVSEGAFSDTVREAQECVELALKGILRFIGIEPPKQHDVGPLLVEYRDKLPHEVAEKADQLAAISKMAQERKGVCFLR